MSYDRDPKLIAFKPRHFASYISYTTLTVANRSRIPLKMAKTAKTNKELSAPRRKRKLLNDVQQTQHDQDRPTKKRNLTAAERARSLRTSKFFPFLRLPPELRNRIYEFALIDPLGREITTKTKDFRSVVRSRRRGARKALPALTPALLATCKQVHDEAIDYLYSQKLSFNDHFALQDFLATLGPRYVQRLRHIRIMRELVGWRRSGALTMLAGAGATKLTCLEFDFVFGFSPYPAELAHHLCRILHFWLSAYGRAQGNPKAGLNIIRLSGEDFGKAKASTLADGDGTDERTFWRTVSDLNGE